MRVEVPRLERVGASCLPRSLESPSEVCAGDAGRAVRVVVDQAVHDRPEVAVDGDGAARVVDVAAVDELDGERDELRGYRPLEQGPEAQAPRLVAADVGPDKLGGAGPASPRGDDELVRRAVDSVGVGQPVLPTAEPVGRVEPAGVAEHREQVRPDRIAAPRDVFDRGPVVGDRSDLAEDGHDDVLEVRPDVGGGEQPRDRVPERLPVLRRGQVLEDLPRLRAAEQELPGRGEERVEVSAARDERLREQVVEVGLVEEADAVAVADEDVLGLERRQLFGPELGERAGGHRQRLVLAHRRDEARRDRGPVEPACARRRPPAHLGGELVVQVLERPVRQGLGLAGQASVDGQVQRRAEELDGGLAGGRDVVIGEVLPDLLGVEAAQSVPASGVLVAQERLEPLVVLEVDGPDDEQRLEVAGPTRFVGGAPRRRRSCRAACR